MTPRTYSLVTPPDLKPFGGNPNYEKNLVAAKVYGDQTQCCCVCGKKAKASYQKVYLSNLGLYITREEYNEDGDDLGLYPVGSDCASKLRAAGIPTFR